VKFIYFVGIIGYLDSCNKMFIQIHTTLTHIIGSLPPHLAQLTIVCNYIYIYLSASFVSYIGSV